MKMQSFLAMPLLLIISASVALAEGSLRTVAFSGDQAPGTSDGVNFLDFRDRPAINDLGQTAFNGVLSGAGGNPTNLFAVFSEGGGAGLELIARSGGQAPGLASEDEFFLLVHRYSTIWGKRRSLARSSAQGSTAPTIEELVCLVSDGVKH